MNPSTPARLLNFYRKDVNTFVVSPNDAGTQGLTETISAEEFSAQIWQVPIQEDWETLDEVTKIRIYAKIMETGRMFFTIDLQRP